MQIRATLKPGQRGTKKWLSQHGDRLVCVRYRYDVQRRRRYTTVEIIVAESQWIPSPPAPDAIVGLRVAFDETDLRKAVLAAGGRWSWKLQLWQLRYDQVLALGLIDRLVLPEE
jgi:predicted aminopeptidase